MRSAAVDTAQQCCILLTMRKRKALPPMFTHLQRLTHAQPFRPFGIHLSGGQVISVENEDWIALSPKGDSVNVFTEDGQIHLLAVSLIVELEAA